MEGGDLWPPWEEEHVKEARELSVFRVLTRALGLSRGRPGCDYAGLVSPRSGYHSLRAGSTGGLKKLLSSAPVGSHW